MTVMRTRVTETVEREVIEKVTCDLCGHEQKADLLEEGEALLDNVFLMSRWTAGFGSRHDMTTFDVSLCDACTALLGSDSEEKLVLQKAVARMHQARAEVGEC